eukprot:9110978-Pyramimonas_sp.AAC.1
MRNLLMPPARKPARFASLFHQEAPRYFVQYPAFRPMMKADTASGASSQGRVQRTSQERSPSSFVRPHEL